MRQSYKKYFKQMPCFVTVQDRDLNIIEANQAFQDGFGDHKGKHCYEMYKNRTEKCEVCSVERTFRDGFQHRSEEKVTTLGGQEISVVVYTTPIRDKAGTIVAVLEMSTDITEIKDMQQKYKESLDRYRLLFDEVPCYISIQDEEMNIVQSNRLHQEMFGPSEGCKCYNVLKNRKRECVPCVVRETFENGKINTREEIVTSKAGEPRYVLVTAAPLRDTDGKTKNVIEMSTDITEIRELQDKLTSVGMSISSIAHDIKGLLNNLDGGIYIVDSGIKKGDEDRISKGWAMTLRSVDRIRSLIMNILYYAKERDLNYEDVNAKTILDELEEKFSYRAKELKVNLTINCDKGEGELEADSACIESMMTNLIENAIDACRADIKSPEHKVEVSWQDSGDDIQFLVQDNGVGMDAETVDHAFTLFYSSKGNSGTGLGLFIAEKIAKKHNGSIKITTELGKGSLFTITIPKKAPN